MSSGHAAGDLQNINSPYEDTCPVCGAKVMPSEVVVEDPVTKYLCNICSTTWERHRVAGSAPQSFDGVHPPQRGNR